MRRAMVMVLPVTMYVVTAVWAAPEAPDRTFVVHFCTRDIREFERAAGLAAKLRSHGRVEFNVSTLAEKSSHDVPEGGSPWHEYAAYNPAPYKFFPPVKLAPFIPADHVTNNRRMLEAKLVILRRHGYGAAFWGYEPNFWPEAFFEKYPHLRGPRTDHPRRSRKDAFAPCVDRPEVQEMISESVAALVKAVPELHTYWFKTNDAGPGLCWSYWQYSGPNGPTFCKHRNMGDRVRDLLDAVLRGAARSGGRLKIRMSGLFSDEERDDIRRRLPEDVTFGRSPDSTWISSGCSDHYPVKGILNPLALLRALERLARPDVKTVFLEFRVSYERGGESLDTVEKVVAMTDDALREPVPKDPAGRLRRLRRLCEAWAGPKHAGRLFDVLVELDEAFKYQRSAFGGIRTLYAGVSARMITRPLVALPDKLSPEEEAYFLPHVFNPHENEARMDTIDIHGTRLVPTSTPPEGTDPRIAAVDDFGRRIEQVCVGLEGLDGAPEETYFRRMATSLRIYCSVLRSVNNFYATQLVRDRNKDVLTGPERIPPKVDTRTGDEDLLLLNAYMRDELDNTAELIRLLESGGLEQVTHAETPDTEDTFLLGVDLVDQLRKKMKVMRDHWLDAQKHLATPMK